MNGDDESDVISQPDPTSCIHVPTFETIVAIHRFRNSAFCSGVQAPAAAGTDAAAAGSAECAGFMGKRYRHSRFSGGAPCLPDR